MKLHIKILLILFLFNSTSSAEELVESIYSFIGVQSSYTNYDSVSTPTFGLKYGKQTSKWRTAISYSYAQESSHKFHSLIMQMDKGVLTDVFRDIPLKPYIGFSLGVMQDQKNSSTDNGYLYGVNLGINYVLSNDFDIDFGYRYMRTDKLKDMDNRGDISLSLHYYF